jgi:hypothetical protein
LNSNLLQRSIFTINKNKYFKNTKLLATPIQSVSPLASSKKLDNTKQKENSVKKTRYCLFYNRFGRCSRVDKCPFIHDPKHVAICPRFLRGTCAVNNCPYSHSVSVEKMPLCSFYADGCCNRDNCPYSHIYFGKDAEFCVDFAKGFCSLGSKVCFIFCSFSYYFNFVFVLVFHQF